MSLGEWGGIVGVGIALLAFVRDWQLRRDLRKASVAPGLQPLLEEVADRLNVKATDRILADLNERGQLWSVLRRIEERISGVLDKELEGHLKALIGAVNEVIVEAISVEDASLDEATGELTYTTSEQASIERAHGAARRGETAARDALRRLASLRSKT